MSDRATLRLMYTQDEVDRALALADQGFGDVPIGTGGAEAATVLAHEVRRLRTVRSLSLDDERLISKSLGAVPGEHPVEAAARVLREREADDPSAIRWTVTLPGSALAGPAEDVAAKLGDGLRAELEAAVCPSCKGSGKGPLAGIAGFEQCKRCLGSRRR